MTEWWQQDQRDVSVPRPRRDVIPDAGFSDPRTVNPEPEATSFIPEFRVRRRKRAIVVTACGAVVIGWWVAVLVQMYFLDVYSDLRRAGALVLYAFGFIAAGVGFAVWFVWKWANARDPRDIPSRLGPN